ncbi:3-oxoacyl-(acyl-carrier-protein) synthase III [Methylocella silvestris BL2]|uniref:Beta-ketoacyl-[acyl-carrier-protein] synthase III n=1 Tax=Methylocella silvestris (strain DSM 15510 / CIP 108128 / LMG 27833 / NCIMB 13906 / BL2) TaxID=395965 RepID=B8EM29_METSB|nr:beta-ketoacyl-ACP synthase III [Methylocella silvestris]ACK51418.1 3-oxoacyl-(acyl-carrier-protein) synthase III [Methylocella silvestris BL2]
MTHSQILGTGAYAPKRVLTNRDLEEMVATTDEWIASRTGIKERRIAAEGEDTSDMAVVAARHALAMAGCRAEDLDMIIVGTISADMPLPSCAVLVQAKLGATRAFAFDISAACSGSLFALSIADRFIETGAARRVLVIGAELLSRLVDWSDRNTCVLFGDAAGAMVLGPTSDPARGLLSFHLHTDGTAADILNIPGGGSRHPQSAEVLAANMHKVHMNGREIYKYAVRVLPAAIQEALDANGLDVSAIDHVVSHQANARIVESVLERVGVPIEKCWLNLDRYGNTSSASLPISLDEANRAGRLKPGDLIAMMAIGAGMAWGSALMRW